MESAFEQGHLCERQASSVSILALLEQPERSSRRQSCLKAVALLKSTACLQVGESGAIPLLVALLQSESREAQDCAVGALANLAVTTRCRELIADADGLSALVGVLCNASVGDGIQEMAVGALTNLAILPQNQVNFRSKPVSTAFVRAVSSSNGWTSERQQQGG